MDSADLLPPETKPKPLWLLFVMAVEDKAKAKSGFLPKLGREREKREKESTGMRNFFLNKFFLNFFII